MKNNKVKEDWAECTLGEICDFIGGGTPSKTQSSYWNGKIPWASIKDIKGDVLLNTQDFITEEGLKNSSANLVRKNEIILATRINPGKPILSKIEASINQDLKVVKTKIDIETSFLFWLFKTLENKVLKLSSGTTVLGINLTNLKSISFYLPPLPIQRAIVAKIESLFSSLDSGIADLKKAQAQLVIYRQAVLKKAFEGKFTNQNVKEGELPKGWKWVKLKDISELITDGDHQAPPKSEKGIPFITISNVNKVTNKINFNNTFKVNNEYYYNLKEHRKPKFGDILYTVTGSYGIPIIIDFEKEFCFQRHIGLIRPLSSVNQKYLYYLLQTNAIFNQAFETATGTAQKTVALSSLRNFNVLFCNDSQEQHQIVKEIESRLSVCDKVEESIKESLLKAEALRQSILKKAFEGKLLSEAEIAHCKQEADYEPAHELLKKIKSTKK